MMLMSSICSIFHLPHLMLFLNFWPPLLSESRQHSKSKDTKKNFFPKIYSNVCLCAYACRYPKRPGESVRSPEAEIIGNCESHPVSVLRTLPCPSLRAANALTASWVLTKCLYFICIYLTVLCICVKDSKLNTYKLTYILLMFCN